MTTEEVIKGMKRLAYEFSGYNPSEEMFNMAVKALENQPQWIPVSERLPKEGEIVLVTTPPYTDTEDGELYLTGVRCARWLFRSTTWFKSDGASTGMGMLKVAPIAWMPLPEPYKEES